MIKLTVPVNLHDAKVTLSWTDLLGDPQKWEFSKVFKYVEVLETDVIGEAVFTIASNTLPPSFVFPLTASIEDVTGGVVLLKTLMIPSDGNLTFKGQVEVETIIDANAVVDANAVSNAVTL